MSHIDTREAAARTFVGSLEELGRRMEPSAGLDYCEACDVPDLAPPQGFFDKIRDAARALKEERHLDAMRHGAEVVEILRTLLDRETGSDARTELLLQRILIPVLLDVLRRGHAWARHDDPLGAPAKLFGAAYTIGIVLLMLDRRIAEWLPDAFAGHRLACLFGGAVDRWRQASQVGDWGEAWPHFVVDGLGPFVALVNAILGQPLETPALQLWQGYGFEPPDGGGNGRGETAAARSLSLWWERHPDFAARSENYALTPPPVSASPLGITLVPLLRDQGGPTIAPFLNGDWSPTYPIGGDWQARIRGGIGAPPPGPVWGRNAAHMAAITRQQPVRIFIHADRLVSGGS